MILIPVRLGIDLPRRGRMLIKDSKQRHALAENRREQIVPILCGNFTVQWQGHFTPSRAFMVILMLITKRWS